MIHEGLQSWDFFKKQQMPHKQQVPANCFDDDDDASEREQEGRSAGVNYLMVGWSRARSKLVGEEEEVQQGDWSSDGKAGRRRSIRETQR